MNSFKTPKGTELPILTLKGKPYLQVAHRIIWFREDWPLGRIETSIIEKTDKFVKYKAIISLPVHGEGISYTHIADADKVEHYAHFQDADEKAQTGAIGRALALCGYGTQFTSEFEEKDRVVDAPVAQKSMTQQPFTTHSYQGPTDAEIHKMQEGEIRDEYVIPFGKFKDKTFSECEEGAIKNYISYLKETARKEGKPLKGIVADFVLKASDYFAF